jgi:hypothetical protein
MVDMIRIRDIHGVATIEVVTEFLKLWDVIVEVALELGTPNVHWGLSNSGQYSTKSAYEALFQGPVRFNLWERIWRSWTPGRCHFFMWLVAHNHYWTADRLARQNLPHSEQCPFCNQEDETIHHLLTGCVFARQFRHVILRRVRLADLAPQPKDFDNWWSRTLTLVSNTMKKGRIHWLF